MYGIVTSGVIGSMQPVEAVETADRLGIWLTFAGVMVTALLGLLAAIVTTRFRRENRADHGEVIAVMQGQGRSIDKLTGEVQRNREDVGRSLRRLHDRVDEHLEHHAEQGYRPAAERRAHPRPAEGSVDPDD